MYFSAIYHGIQRLYNDSLVSQSLYNLDLSHNSISHPQMIMFQHLPNIYVLNLNNNAIVSIGYKVFVTMLLLENLTLQQNPLTEIDSGAFVSNTRLHTLRSDWFMLCCIAEQADACSPSRQTVSSCTNLISMTSQRYIFIIQAATSLITNVAAFIRGDLSQANIMESSLHLSDGMMGVYLGHIAIVDFMHRDKFNTLIIEWSRHLACHSAALCSFVSMEMSLCSLAIMAFVRALTVTQIGGYRNVKIKVRKAIIMLWFLFVCLGVSLTAVSMSVNPLLHNNMCLYFGDKARIGASTVDQILHLSYFVLNFSLIFATIASYVMLCKQIYESKKTVSGISTATSANKHMMKRLSLKILLLVGTNVVCWVPFLLVSILSMSGYKVQNWVLGWVVVLIIPINATINPFLYFTITNEKKCC